MGENKIEKYIDSLRETKQTIYFPFDIISRKISLLLEGVNILGNHLEEFPESWKKVFKENNIKAGVWLNDYVLLEIKDFYRIAHLNFKGNIIFPESVKAVEDFRHEIVGHLKKKTQEDLVEHYIEINKDVGFDKILEDWKEFRDMIFKKIENKTQNI